MQCPCQKTDSDLIWRPLALALALPGTSGRAGVFESAAFRNNQIKLVDKMVVVRIQGPEAICGATGVCKSGGSRTAFGRERAESCRARLE